MATVTFYVAANMSSPSIWRGRVTSYDSSHITVSNGHLTGTYSGSFTYNSSGLSGGTLTGYAAYIDGILAAEVSGLNANAVKVAQYVDAGNAIGVYSYALQNDDLITGSDFADKLLGFAGHDEIWGGIGNDLLNGGNGNDLLNGGDGKDKLTGGTGNDSMHGESGNDSINGGDGNDTIFGGQGNDLLTGGKVVDIFIIGATDGAGSDVITDFSATTSKGATVTGTSDTLTVFGHDSNAVLGFDRGDFEVGDPAEGKGVLINFKDGGSVLLKNVNLHDLVFNENTDGSGSFTIDKGQGHLVNDSD